MRSSSTDHAQSGNNPEIEKDHHSRGAEGYSGQNVPMDIGTSKPRRDKTTNKGQQDEEEERGKTSPLKKNTK